MSTFKTVLLVAAMIGGVVAGIHYGGKSFFHELVGGGPFPSATETKRANAWAAPAAPAAPTSPRQEDWIRQANAPQGQQGAGSEKEDLGYGAEAR